MPCCTLPRSGGGLLSVSLSTPTNGACSLEVVAIQGRMHPGGHEPRPSFPLLYSAISTCSDPIGGEVEEIMLDEGGMERLGLSW